MRSTIASVLIALMLGGVAYSQSLGDVARANRRAQNQKKKAARVYTNDDIPSVEMKPAGPISPDARYGSAAGDSDSEPTAANAAQSADEKKDAATKPAGSDKQANKNDSDYKSRIEEQQKAIGLLERELSVSQRQLEIQTAVFYSDAGTRLRNPKDWTEKQKAYQESLESKQKALADAKAKLEDIMEESRKAGATSESADKAENKEQTEDKDR